MSKKSEMQEKGVSNNSYWRDKSDRLDEAMGWTGGYKEDSAVRGTIHGVYHSAVGVIKHCSGNTEGAQAEFDRAS